MQSLVWMASFLRPYRSWVTGLAALSLAEIALRVVAPWPLKIIVDRLAGGPLTGVEDRSAAALVAVVAAGVLVQAGHEIVLMYATRRQARLGQRLILDLRSQLFTQCQYLTFAEHQRRPAADFVYRIEEDATCLEQMLVNGLLPSLASALTLVVMFGILLRLDVVLAVIALVVVPLLYGLLRLATRRMHPRAQRAKALDAALVGRIFESLGAIRLVKTYAREAHEVARFDDAARAAMQARAGTVDDESRVAFGVAAITLGGASVVLAVGGLHVLDGRLSVGTLLVVVAYVGFVYGPMAAIAGTIGSLQRAMASARRVREILALPREDAGPRADAAPSVLSKMTGEVRFDRVTFGYEVDRPVLRNLSLVARAGETVALVGVSGAGKSTLISLIGRAHEPQSGRVLLDGVDVRRYPLAELREQIAVVLQEPILFAGSMADNIRYGRLDATDEEVAAAARAANCDAFIAELPDGLHTPIGEGGSRLSVGQRQRVSIARAILKNAPILLLDEPTASLDALAEHAVLDALGRLRRGRTTFLIAHRLSSVRAADRILVLEAGTVAASGRHETLLRTSPLYARLCRQLADAVDPVAV